ncbi:hypothetical protein ICE98_00256 [Lactococcus lactis]|nr:hypothetical protein [Lactococcus lactis]
MILVTAHRRENLSDLEEIFDGIAEIADEFKETHKIIYPIPELLVNFHWKINKSCDPNLKPLSIRKRTTYMTYNSTLPKVFVYLLTTIETLYQTRVSL